MTSPYAGFKVRQRPPGSARKFPAEPAEFLRRYRDDGEALLAQPFKGITADGMLVPDLFRRQHHAKFDHARADHSHAHPR
jgi:hypothetical protein